jgi:hypothetical protein
MRRIRHRLRRPSASIVISLLALFVALSGTAVATTNIVPLAKRALSADKAKVANVAKNSLKVQNQTAEQISQTPGPATTLNGQTADQIIAAAVARGGGSIAGKFTVRSAGWSIGDPASAGADWYANCNPGEKAVGGGFDEVTGKIVVSYNRPKTDGSGWWFKAQAINDASLPAAGSVWVVCAS